MVDRAKYSVVRGYPEDDCIISQTSYINLRATDL